MRRLLVANRGEIAMRVFRACETEGIETVAVFAADDSGSLHARSANASAEIASYLDPAEHVRAARETGADAVHPGYGFLSESAELAEAVLAAGLTWVGPPPAALRAGGDKLTAKETAHAAGVPVVPTGPAEEIGYPLLVKAAAGGGGRGMRVVRGADELANALKTAQREAQAAFGVGDVYLEKYIEGPRHIEFQILGDHHGAVVHLGERECSIQRRHQKLVEEAPSMALTEKMRRKLGNTVVDAAKAVQYTNAGTFEFLMDQSGAIYFIEANTRLQVEHGVTELVTGIDIVKEQIRIAAGERLAFRQSDVKFSGHAIECRVNAENPETFTPSPGLIHAFSTPGGPGVRTDTFAHSECTISPYYDSLVAKIMAHGRTRDEAIARMRRTLEMTVVEGIQTTIPLHLKIMADPDFQAGRLSTAFMERFQTEQQKEQQQRKASLAAAV
jgi:acetyl-CoA carboxylase biotin carboxylase subunit